GGRLLGIVGVDQTGGSWQWCSFNYPHSRIPVVSRALAIARVRARRQSLGLDGASGRGVPGGSSPGSNAAGEEEAADPVLIQGCDKHLYWHLEDSNGEAWLVDAMIEDADVLGTLDRSAGRALTPQEALYEGPGDGPGLLENTGDALGLLEGSGAPESPVTPGIALLADTPPAYNIPGVPYHFQITSWYCGPASLQMVMDYWGEEVNQNDIADVANDVVDYGVSSEDMRRAAHFSGMSACVQNPSLYGYTERQLGYACAETGFLSNPGQKLKNTVYEGYPVFILTWFSPTHGSGHFRLVKGWDDSLSAYIIHDPWYYGSLSGPDLIMSETMLIDDLWVYSGRWAMVACPWELEPEIAVSPAAGDTFSVDLQVYYPGPTFRFQGQYNCTGCEATIALPAGLSLAGGAATKPLPDMVSGDTTWVSWDVVAASQGDYSMAFQAQGTLTGSSGSYPTYTDSIGGHASETVSVGSTLLAGWEDEEQLTVGEGSSLLCSPGARAMIAGSTGEVHLVWSDTNGGTNDIYYMKRSAGAWGLPVKINDFAGFATTPCIAEGPDGRLHVAWVDGRNGNHEIYYKYWDSSGGWSAEERVTTDAEVDYCPAIAAGDTAVYIAWERRLGGAYRVSAVHFSERTGPGWSAPVDVDASAARDSYHPSLAYGPDGILYLAYERQTANSPDEHEKIVMKTWDGLVWSARTGISDNIGFSRNPCIAAGSDTTLHIVWQDADGGYGAIYYAYNDGAAWQPNIQISPPGTEATTPSVAVDGEGVAHVAWSDHRHADTEIYYAAYESQVLQDGARLSAAPGISSVPTVAAGSTGGPCVVWCDTRDGTADLYFRTVDDESGISADRPAIETTGGVRLASPSPNPFNATTRISFSLALDTRATVQVFDVEGRLVATPAEGSFTAGHHSVSWNGTSASGSRAAAGIYFIRCSSPIGEDVRRVVLAR
ncbi:MAG: C39 family peptidase, partial [bacterium]